MWNRKWWLLRSPQLPQGRVLVQTQVSDSISLAVPTARPLLKENLVFTEIRKLLRTGGHVVITVFHSNLNNSFRKMLGSSAPISQALPHACACTQTCTHTRTAQRTRNRVWNPCCSAFAFPAQPVRTCVVGWEPESPCHSSRNGSCHMVTSAIPTMPGDGTESAGLLGHCFSLPLEKLIGSGTLQACQFSIY